VQRALFVCYGGGHAKMVIPVVRELMADSGWLPIVLGLTTAGPQMRAAGIVSYGYRDLLRPGDDAALAHGRRLLGDSHDPTSGISVEESIAYLGLSYQDIVERLGADGAAELYRVHARHAFLQFGPLRRAIEKWRPNVVVTTNSPKSERAALVVAREAGIPTVGMEDLLGIRQALIRDFVPKFRADRLCVGSTIAIDNLVRDEGTPRESCRLTGNPQFDRLARVAARRDEARGRLGIARTERYAVLYTQTSPDEELIRKVLAAATASGARIAVRRHPNHRAMPADDFRGVVPHVDLVDDADLDDLLAAADVAISISSTVALEALLVGNVVVQLGPNLPLSRPSLERLADLPLHSYGVTVLADDAATLRDAIESSASGEAARRRAAEIFVAPGTAAKAVADQIREVATAA
jgi:hypothetical protein